MSCEKIHMCLIRSHIFYTMHNATAKRKNTDKQAYKQQGNKRSAY